MQFAIVTVLAVVAVCAYAKPIAIESGGGGGDGGTGGFGGGYGGGYGGGLGGGFGGGGIVEGGGGEFKSLLNPLIPSPIRSMFKSVVRE